MDDFSATDPLDLALQRELRRGERLIRKIRPLARINKASFAMWLFAIPWTVFSLFWTGFAAAGTGLFSEEGGPGLIGILFPLFGVPFVLFGFAMLAMPFAPLYTAPKTLFAITNERLIKLYLGKTLQSESVPAERVGLINRTERRDGSGMLKIVKHIRLDSDGDKVTETFDIGEVADVLAVENSILDISLHAKRTTV